MSEDAVLAVYKQPLSFFQAQPAPLESYPIADTDTALLASLSGRLRLFFVVVYQFQSDMAPLQRSCAPISTPSSSSTHRIRLYSPPGSQIASRCQASLLARLLPAYMAMCCVIISS